MRKGNFIFKKTTVECYKFRHESGMYWADITIDVTGDRSGRISIASDYGNYSNFWGACSSGFKQFLVDLNFQYAADKFGADRWFDLDLTLKGYKTRLLKNRIDETYTAEQASEIWDEIKELEDCSSITEFEVRMWNQSKLMKMFDHCPDIDYGIKPQFKSFWNTIWPIFIKEIKSELLINDAVAK